jgi:hypothetical protein
MSTLNTLFVAVALAAAPGNLSADKRLPADWPPMPDFVHPVDYLGRWTQINHVPPEHDAWPLWRELNTGASADYVARLGMILSENNATEMRAEVFSINELTRLAELLQFAYAQDGDVWSLPPAINKDNVAALEKLAAVWDIVTPEHEKKPVDLRTGIVNCDPFVAVQQLTSLHLRVREITAMHLPAEAHRQVQVAIERFREDPATHVILREFTSPYMLPIELWARAEASRRASHVLVALHGFRIRTGTWPRHLREIRKLVAPDMLVDPFSRKEFIYRLEDGQPLLYSVAANGRDDGGKHHKHWGWHRDDEPKPVDYVFWPIPNPSGSN